MGTASEPPPVKLISALLYQNEAAARQALDRLTAEFGPIDSRSEVFPFTFSPYYEKEMGNPLYKTIVSYERLIDSDTIGPIKSFTNELEQELSGQGVSPDSRTINRCINVDPGYLNDAKVVLATTKDFSHRIYLGDGIFAEPTLEYRKGAYRHYDWTYPDYRSVPVLRYLESVRQLFMEQR